MSTVAISPRDTATFAADLAETHYVDGATLVARASRLPASHLPERRAGTRHRSNPGDNTSQPGGQDQCYTGAKERSQRQSLCCQQHKRGGRHEHQT